MIRAEITPGTQPIQVKMRTINTEPQPLSTTARGGKIIAKSTCKQLIPVKVNLVNNWNAFENKENYTSSKNSIIPEIIAP